MKKYALWLSNIKGMTSSKIFYLLKQFHSAKEIYGLSKSDYLQVKGIDQKLAEVICDSKKYWSLEGELYKLQESGISFISWEEIEFPEKLRVIANAPYCIYYKGNLPRQKERSVAIVGARARSAYGQQIAQQLSTELARKNVNIISGLALGIDADAHKGALRGNGRTYGVLGCGIDQVYPTANAYLYDEIEKTGGVISEYPPGVMPNPYLFPARNRIISAFSDCVIVIEAKEKSGSLITADFALEQGKDVYALPGRITDALSAGTNYLIKQGAQPLYNIEEFLKEWDIFDGNDILQIDFRKNTLEKDELLVYSLLDFCPVSIGTLMEETNLTLSTLIDILQRLERKGFIKETVPNYFIQTV